MDLNKCEKFLSSLAKTPSVHVMFERLKARPGITLKAAIEALMREHAGDPEFRQDLLNDPIKKFVYYGMFGIILAYASDTPELDELLEISEKIASNPKNFT